ncbi:MAG TPA: DUF599 family protein [Geminicoccaceae bacterium]|nr:DUF599 family protein [Geminicoccaceae bacterium]
MLPDLSGTALPDLLAPAWFLLCWLGYTYLADREQSRGSLMRTMYAYRALWARQLLHRDNRMVDTQIIANLMRSVSFFASTTMFIIAGLIAVIGARDRAMAVLAELPFAAESSPLLWDLKVLLLIVVFVYAFFKFTWAFRHYNYCLVLVGCVPAPDRLTEDSPKLAERLARIASATARHFNRGIRAYYFGLAALSWFIDPFLFMLLSAWVVLVLYRREFRSRLLRMLAAVPEDDAAPLRPER